MIGNLIRGRIKAGGGGAGNITVEAEAGFALPTSLPAFAANMPFYYSVEDDTGAQLEAGIAPVTLSGSDAVVGRADATAIRYSTITGLTGTRVYDDTAPAALTLNAGVTVWFGPIAENFQPTMPDLLPTTTNVRRWIAPRELQDTASIGSGSGLVANKYIMYPFTPVVPLRSVVKLGVYIETAFPASNSALLGLYLPKANGAPGLLLRDGGVISISSAGWIESTAFTALSLPPIPLWAAIVMQINTTGGIRGAPSTGGFSGNAIGLNESSGRFGKPSPGVTATYSTGWGTPALSDPAPTALTGLTWESVPVVYLVQP